MQPIPPPLSTKTLLWMTLLFQGAITLIGIALAIYFKLPWRSWFDWSTVLALVGIISGSLFALLIVAIEINWQLDKTQLAKDLIELMRKIGYQPVYALLLVSIAAGVSEEILFRAVLQPIAIEKLGSAIGIITISLLFGLAHAISFAYFIYASFLGLLLGLFFYLGNNLIATILVHTVYDFIAFYFVIHVHHLYKTIE